MTLRTRTLGALLGLLACAGGIATGCGGSDDDAARKTTPGPRLPASVTDTRFVALGEASPVVGIADNRPQMLTDPRFAFTQIKRVRVTVPYDDVSSGGARMGVQDAWFAAAQRAGIEPLVSFYRSYANPRFLPSPAGFERSVRAFQARYPWVRRFSVWSEPNSSAQPTARDPRRVAAYYRVLQRLCARDRCTVVAGDYRLDRSAASRAWLETYIRALGPGARLWGLSAFEDTLRRSNALTRDFLRRTEGPVWVDEIGGERVRGRDGLASQRRQIAYLVDDYARVSGRIKRVYVYSWRAAPRTGGFDSALLDSDGRPRPAYRELNRGIGRLTPVR